MKRLCVGAALAILCSGTALGADANRSARMQGMQGPGMQGQGPGPVGMFPHFGNIDTNDDGYLSKAEIEAHQQQLRSREQFMQELADEADKSPDGRISAAEFAALEQKQEQLQEQQPQPQQPSQSP